MESQIQADNCIFCKSLDKIKYMCPLPFLDQLMVCTNNSVQPWCNPVYHPPFVRRLQTAEAWSGPSSGPMGRISILKKSTSDEKNTAEE